MLCYASVFYLIVHKYSSFKLAIKAGALKFYSGTMAGTSPQMDLSLLVKNARDKSVISSVHWWQGYLFPWSVVQSHLQNSALGERRVTDEFWLTCIPVIFVHDYFLTLNHEIHYIWRRKFKLGLYAFVMARYGGILSLVMPVFIGSNTPQVWAHVLK